MYVRMKLKYTYICMLRHGYMYIYKNAHMYFYVAIVVEATSLNILTSQLGEYMQTASMKISIFAFLIIIYKYICS